MIKQELSNLYSSYLIEDNFVIEMGNFIADVTDLPANIVIWTKPQPNELPHSKYRMKIFKDRAHVATYSIDNDPVELQTYPRNGSLDGHETAEVVDLISKYSQIFREYVDGKLSDREVKGIIKNRLEE